MDGSNAFGGSGGVFVVTTATATPKGRVSGGCRQNQL